LSNILNNTPKFTRNGIFGLKNMPSGNPAFDIETQSLKASLKRLRLCTVHEFAIFAVFNAIKEFKLTVRIQKPETNVMIF
jgi:hypothetical protein